MFHQGEVFLALGQLPARRKWSTPQAQENTGRSCSQEDSCGYLTGRRGDTFAGWGTSRHVLTGSTTWEDMKQAVTVGSVMASFTCEAFGTEGLASLDVDTLRARHNAYLALTACGDVVWPQG